MFCKNCGQQLAEGAAFCPNCGAAVPAEEQPIQAETQPVQTQEQPTEAQPVQAAQQPYTPPQPQQPYAPQPPYGQPGYGNAYVPQAKPSMTWLIVNIVIYVLSGFMNILSLIGLIFGAIGQSSYNKGDYVDAENKTKVCKTLGIISLVLFIIGVLATIFFFLVGLFAAPSYY